MAQIGISKEQGLLDRYTLTGAKVVPGEQGSVYATQPDNQTFAGNVKTVGGFTPEGTYSKKYLDDNGNPVSNIH